MASALGHATPGVHNVFYWLFANFERPFLALLAAFMLLAAAYLAKSQSLPEYHSWQWLSRKSPIVLLSGAVVVAALVGHRALMHSYPLSLDEYNSAFQSRIFASGHVSTVVPQPWNEVAPLITPGMVTYYPAEASWMSAYLPVYAGLRAIALQLRAASMLNPLFAGLSILLAAWLARQLWPRQREAALLTAILMAASSQFLATSMTLYSMPAHLFLNLLWLVLYLRAERQRERWSLVALPWVGVLALGLHNPFPHALFATPFLLRLVRWRRLGTCAYLGLVYVAGCMLWLMWFHHSVPPAGRAVALTHFGFPDALHALTQAMSMSEVVSWQSPILVLGLGAAVVGMRSLDWVERDLCTGLALTIGFYCFYLSSQGHGWGYRYVYNVLGNVVLLSTGGLLGLVKQYGRTRMARLCCLSLLLTVTVQLPLRAHQIEGFVSPFAAASTEIASSMAAAVVVPVAQVWYGSDLIRNAPELSVPVVVALSGEHPLEQRRWLARHFGDRVRYLRPEELAALGLSVTRRPE